MIQGLMDWQAGAIIDAKLGNTDAESYIFETMVAILDWREKINNDKHGKNLQNQRKHFLHLFFLFTAC